MKRSPQQFAIIFQFATIFICHKFRCHHYTALAASHPVLADATTMVSVLMKIQLSAYITCRILTYSNRAKKVILPFLI